MITALSLKNLRKPGRYAVGHGVYLQITGAHGRSWIFRYHGRYIGLGSTKWVSLAEAREQGLELRRLLRAGIDPLQQRAAQQRQLSIAAAKDISFRDCAERFMASHEAAWSNPVHRRQWRQSMRDHVFPTLGAVPVAAIDTAMVMKTIEPIWTTVPTTADRARSRIEAVLDWAKARDYRDGENPARWRGHLDHLLPKKSKLKTVKHYAALPYVEAPAFMAALRQQEGTAARAIEFLILTAGRVGEVVGARWDEIDFETGIWTIPAGRMKGRREHRVPLSPRAMEILQALPREQAQVFISPRLRRPLSSQLVGVTLTRMMGRSDITLHGFRSTFRDWTAECTNFPREVCEQALAHAISSDVEAAYRRGDLIEKRRKLMAAWADYCGRPAQDGATVTSIGRSRRA